jgi:hypothetical protein
MTQFRANRRRAAPRHLGFRASAAPSRGAAHTSRRLEAHASLAGRSRHQVIVGPPAVLLCVRAPPKVRPPYHCNDAGESSPRRLRAAHAPAYKWCHPSSLAPRSAAVRHGHRRGELPVRSRDRPCENTTTTVNDHHNFPCRSRIAPAAPFAGVRAPAAARPWRRRAAPPTVDSTQPSPGIEPEGPAGAPSAGAQGSICEVPNLFEGQTTNRGHNRKISKLLGTSVQICISNSKVILLTVVNSVENRRKSEKCKTNFVGFLVKSTSTFVILE